MTTNLRTSTFTFPSSQRQIIDPYLPPLPPTITSSPPISNATAPPASSNSPLLPPTDPTLPFLTLTYATSLDSTLSLTPGVYHPLSSPSSMALTLYLRPRFSAILIGVGTAIADNPGLNCRLDDHPPGVENQPRPVVVDPKARWRVDEEGCQFLKLCKEGKGKAPWIVTGLREEELPQGDRETLERYGGRYLCLPAGEDGRLDWRVMMQMLKKEGLDSVLIDGGGKVINDWLGVECQKMLDTVVVTVAPTWLGRGGVVVCPERRVDAEGNAQVAARVGEVRWVGMGEDVVMLGRFRGYV